MFVEGCVCESASEEKSRVHAVRRPAHGVGSLDLRGYRETAERH